MSPVQPPRPQPRVSTPRRTRRPTSLAWFVARVVSGSAAGSDASRFFRSVVYALLGLCLATGAAMSDVYFHRGVETSASPPYVVQVSGRDPATNVDLLAFSPEQVDSVASILKTSGFLIVRQPFSWASIEPERGQFSWDPYDRLVGALNSHGIQIVAVLADSPDWARSLGAVGTLDAPPANVADYAAFVQQVVGRYKRKVQFVQLWDLPNRADHWGGTAATPVQYADLLANGFNAARTGEAETKVVLAEFDPSGDGRFGADIRFLRAIYDLGRSAFFDVVAARIDGGTSSPYDRTVDPQRANLSRAVLFRELMMAKGDQTKPVWLTHYGWQTGPGSPVSPDERADFLLGAMERAHAEWPWLGLMFAWDLMPNGTSDASAGYALLNADRTATPAFEVLSSFGTSPDASLAGTGFVPMESRPISYGRNWSDQHLDERVFKTTGETTASATLRFQGTGVLAYLRQSNDAGRLRATLDGGPLPGWSGDGAGSVIDLQSFQAHNVWLTLASELADRPHELVLTLDSPKALTIGGIVISREPPLVWPVALLAVAALVLLVRALRELSYLAATRAGYLQRRRGVELRPPLPHLPDWRPMRRT
ncbi:MAG: polysaccharide biosynthesis protein PslG [Thermomicrobiales bacterium]|nr:polysaccharide biosynthesis protein PslG [Thermomicrobiales bacterium]